MDTVLPDNADFFKVSMESFVVVSEVAKSEFEIQGIISGAVYSTNRKVLTFD
jgi:hypothetical protein